MAKYATFLNWVIQLRGELAMGRMRLLKNVVRVAEGRPMGPKYGLQILRVGDAFRRFRLFVWCQRERDRKPTTGREMEGAKKENYDSFSRNGTSRNCFKRPGR